MNIFEVIPGIYEVQARDVPDPSEGGTYHYRTYGVSGYYVVDSYAYGVSDMVTITARYHRGLAGF